MNNIHDDEYFMVQNYLKQFEEPKVKSWESIIKQYYRNQIERCKKGYYKKNKICVEWSLDEFTNWMEDNKEKFEKIKSCGETPSVDRIDNKGNYNKNNCRLIPNKLNVSLGKITSLQKQLKSLYEYCDSMRHWL